MVVESGFEATHGEPMRPHPRNMASGLRSSHEWRCWNPRDGAVNWFVGDACYALRGRQLARMGRSLLIDGAPGDEAGARTPPLRFRSGSPGVVATAIG